MSVNDVNERQSTHTQSDSHNVTTTNLHVFTINFTMKIPSQSLSLKQFMLRGQVLQLYRDFFRCLKQLPSKADRNDMTQWVKDDFKSNKNMQDEEAIKMMITRGKIQLRELRKMANLSL
ncbi:hypothetical protein CAPTEDRAFT_184234 [Capitella teleta]|uniref:LYR motif-containing protein 2 n=1 Tax=Capitella teleta TaxID=283909 RepID=X1ZGX0_CAPTE|nr:hypothetical protein CAPTEDRAFT_184234 [Capitella teleta]|eukprot:ELU00289.1 hypothetical protein CAPTEDRAFT_184234 [Capitella teleta]